MTESDDYIRGLQWAGRLAMHLSDCAAVPKERRTDDFVYACVMMIEATAKEIERLKTGTKTDDQSGHNQQP
jgi:hypothetical protein